MLQLATLLLFASTGSAFFRMGCPSRLYEERIDPIVDPGKISGHVHTISGGSGFNFDTTFDQLRESKCTSCAINEDMSAYWTPKLYYKAENGTFLTVPQAGDGGGNMGGHTVYYLQRPGPNNDKLHAFPEGFRMIAGDPTKRNFTGGFDAQAVSYVCLNYQGPAPVPEGNAMPNVNCPDGLRAQIFFPSCWDGVNLDSADHKSHMAYPASGAYNTGTCPDSHPVHMISLFYEIIYQTNNFADMWYGDKQPFVFAMGDDTGYGFHGDFINGWDVNVLQNAVDNCNADSGTLEDCNAFTLQSSDAAQACKLPTTIDEQIQGPLQALPGCNPIQEGPAPAKKIACDSTATIGQAQTDYTDVTKSKDWAYLGCGTDNVGSRTFTDMGMVTSDSMTVESCIDTCSGKGYTYAGLEYANQCFCGNSIPANRAPVAGIMGSCNMPCAGSSSEICGGAAALSIYQKCTGSTCENASFSGVDSGNTTTTTTSQSPSNSSTDESSGDDSSDDSSDDNSSSAASSSATTAEAVASSTAVEAVASSAAPTSAPVQMTSTVVITTQAAASSTTAASSTAVASSTTIQPYSSSFPAYTQYTRTFITIRRTRTSVTVAAAATSTHHCGGAKVKV